MAKLPIKIEEKTTLTQMISGEWDFSNLPEGSILIEMENAGRIDVTEFFKKMSGRFGKITFKEEDKTDRPISLEGDMLVV